MTAMTAISWCRLLAAGGLALTVRVLPGCGADEDSSPAPIATTSATGTGGNVGGAGGAGAAGGAALGGQGGGGGAAGQSPVGPLHIDPDFDPEALTGSLRTWYDRLWAAIEHPDQYPDATAAAMSNDTYEYGRSLNTHITTLLHVFGLTGDVRLLDEIDRLAELMRAELEDWSIVEYQGTVYEADGYLNWLYNYDEGYIGTDAHEMDEILSHSLVASFAYAFEVNRSVDERYAERADFWLDYLRNHFEAKWRARQEVPTGPFMDKYLTHAYTQWIRYHHYMYLLTGESWYEDEALRKTEIVDLQMVPIDGDATRVWDHFTSADPAATPSGSMCQPFVYGRYTLQAAADLAFAGVGAFASPGFMEQLAGMVRDHIIDNGATDFAPDVCGGVSLGGIPASAYPRETQNRWAASPYAEAARWDSTDTIANVCVEVHEARESDPDHPRQIYIAAGMVMALWP